MEAPPTQALVASSLWNRLASWFRATTTTLQIELPVLPPEVWTNVFFMVAEPKTTSLVCKQWAALTSRIYPDLFKRYCCYPLIVENYPLDLPSINDPLLKVQAIVKRIRAEAKEHPIRSIPSICPVALNLIYKQIRQEEDFFRVCLRLENTFEQSGGVKPSLCHKADYKAWFASETPFFQAIQTFGFWSLRFLPPEIAILKGLQSLAFLECNLDEIPMQILQLKQLKVLSFYKCVLTEKALAVLQQLPALTTIKLAPNSGLENQLIAHFPNTILEVR